MLLLWNNCYFLRMQCSYGQCQIAFHPTCARNTGLYMNVKTVGGRLQHKAYCDKHSLEQREVSFILILSRL